MSFIQCCRDVAGGNFWDKEFLRMAAAEKSQRLHILVSYARTRQEIPLATTTPSLDAGHVGLLNWQGKCLLATVNELSTRCEYIVQLQIMSFICMLFIYWGHGQDEIHCRFATLVSDDTGYKFFLFVGCASGVMKTTHFLLSVKLHWYFHRITVR